MPVRGRLRFRRQLSSKSAMGTQYYSQKQKDWGSTACRFTMLITILSCIHRIR